MSHLDDVIRSDLSALGTETARAMPPFDELRASLVGSGSPYRDDAAGVEARRRDAGEGRLRELALLPPACERVFVHRVSRAAAGAVAVMAVLLAAGASMDPWTQRLVSLVFGRPTAPLVGALLGGAALAAYVLAGLVAERYYERRLRLHLHSASAEVDGPSPAAEARRLIARVDSVAVALPLAGVATGGLFLGLLLFFSDTGYSALGLLAECRDVFFPAVLFSVLFGVALGGACSREHRSLVRPMLVAVAAHWSTLATGTALMVATLWFAARTALGLHAYGILPGHLAEWMLGGLGLLSLWLPTAWALLWLRRREHARLGE